MTDHYKALKKAAEASSLPENIGKTVAVSFDTIEILAIERTPQKAKATAMRVRPDGSFITHVTPKSAPIFLL